jgi:hypothetical protein
MLAAAVGAFASGTWEADGDGYYRIPIIGEFKGVVNSTPADVIIRAGADYSIRAKGDSRILRHFVFDVRDGRLRIRNPWRPWYLFALLRYHEIFVEVTVPELNSVASTGAGNVRVEDLMRGDTLELRTTGPGSISAQGDADVIKITVTGSGDINFVGSCDKADLALSSPGDVHISLSAQAIAAEITGAGDVDIGGSAEELHLRLAGPGQFRGSGFTASKADITINGSGDAVLVVEQELEARLTGSGDLRLVAGSPVIDAKTTGIGRVARGE